MKTPHINRTAALCLGIGLLFAAQSCEVRDDYPTFEHEQVEGEEDFIPEDNDILPITQRIMDGTAYFKTFLMDSARTIWQGCEYTHIRFLDDLDRRVSMHVLEIDRTKADVSIQALSPFGEYLYHVAQPLPDMMRMNEPKMNGTLLAAITGAELSAGQPFCTHVQNGRLIVERANKTRPMVGVRKDNGAIEVLNSPHATDFPVPAVDAAQYSQIIGGANWMLFRHDGKDMEMDYSSTTTIARTSIGFTPGMQKIYCIAVDGVDDLSAGIMLNSKRTVFKALGCNQAFYTRGSAFSSLGLRQETASGHAYALKNLPPGGTPGGINYAFGFVAR